MKRTLVALPILVVAALQHAGAAHAEHERHERIRALAETHARVALERTAPSGATVRVTASRLDPRVRLPACPVSPDTFDSARGLRASVTVGVRCSTGTEWTLYVPVQAQVTARVVVLGAPAARGQQLSSDLLLLEPRNIAQLPGGYLTETAEADGLMLRRAAAPGTVLTPSMLQRPPVVRRGERVRIRVSGRGFAVDSEGEVLADAAAGERVRVRNIRSGSIVEGFAGPGGTVTIL